MNEPSPTTEELITRIRAGQDEEHCFHLLYERHRNLVYWFFLRKKLPPEDCRELTQEVFFSVYKGMNRLRQPALFTAWMFAIVENVWCSHLEMIKAKKRLANLVSLDDERETEEGEFSSLADRLPDLAPGAFEFVLQQEKLEKLSVAILSLPPQQRRCFNLYFAEELSHQEIADFMNLAVGTVKAHLHQAKQALRETLKTDFKELDS